MTGCLIFRRNSHQTEYAELNGFIVLLITQLNYSVATFVGMDGQVRVQTKQHVNSVITAVSKGPVVIIMDDRSVDD